MDRRKVQPVSDNGNMFDKKGNHQFRASGGVEDRGRGVTVKTKQFGLPQI